MKHKIGLALGGGSARGLSHIGVLKVLEQYQLRPQYIAGTSMGAVIGALYAAGYTPEQIEDIAKTTEWKNIMDFTLPKSGLLEGRLVQQKLRQLLGKKTFGQLKIPLRVVAYNLSKHQKVVFQRGDVVTALRASLSIPGIFSPLKIKHQLYVDGVIADPTPFDVVREMGAKVVIAVDLYKKQEIVEAEAQEESFLGQMKQFLVEEELRQAKKLIIPKEWPGFLRHLLRWVFDKLLYPARVLRLISGRKMPPIMTVMNDSLTALYNNLAVERMRHAQVEVKITPQFRNLHWADFDKVEEFVKIGETAMMAKINQLKKRLTDGS